MKRCGILGAGLLSSLLIVPGLANAQQGRPAAVPDLPGPIDSLRDLQDTGRMLFMIADTNHDGQISQKEATDAGDLMVGGFFFRADADGNGVVTKQEVDAARDEYLNQNPWMKYVYESLKGQAQQKSRESNQPTPVQSLATLIDTNNDKQIQASELRQFVQTTVQSLYAAADTNRDGQMSPSEVNAAVAGGARAVAQAAFQQADTDHSGQLSRAEFDKAILEPANIAFQVIDLNHDGQLSPQETQTIGRVIVTQIRALRLPEPANSPTNLIENRRLPREVAPVPTFGTANNPQDNAQPAPAPAPPR